MGTEEVEFRTKMRLSILMVLLIKKSDQGVPIYEGYSDQEVVSSCVNRIVKRHFDSEHQVTILTQGSKDYVKGIESKVRLIANVSKQDKMSWFPRTRQAVVFLDGDFRRDLSVLISLGTFHPRSRFLIVCTTGDTGLSTKSYLINVVQHLHQNHRSAIAIGVKPVVGAVRLYGYTKTAYGNCGNPEILSFGKCSDEKSLSRLFPTAINHNKCPLRLATFDWPPFTKLFQENGQTKSTGIESSLVNIIVERLNASTHFLTASASEIVVLVNNRDADIGYGQIAMYEIGEAFYTRSYVSVQGSVLVPKLSPASRLTLNSLTPLEDEVWMAIILVIFFVIIVRIIFPVFKVISMLNVLALFMGLSVKAKPMRQSERAYFISMILFGYIMAQAYLANLTMVFTKASDQSQIRSLDELDKSKVQFGGPKAYAKIFKEKYPRLYKEFKVMNLTEFYENLERLRTGRRGLATYVQVSKYKNYNHWKNTVMMPEIMNSYPATILLPNVSSISSTCNWFVSAVLEAGLMDSWARRFNHEIFAADAMAEETKGSDRMDLQQFLKIFRLLGIGLGLSAAVFMIELLVGFYRRKKGRLSRK